MAEVAVVFDISINVVYYWIEHRHVRARRGPGGRWFIDFDADTEVACRKWVATSVHLKADLQSQTARSIEEEAV